MTLNVHLETAVDVVFDFLAMCEVFFWIAEFLDLFWRIWQVLMSVFADLVNTIGESEGKIG